MLIEKKLFISQHYNSLISTTYLDPVYFNLSCVFILSVLGFMFIVSSFTQFQGTNLFGYTCNILQPFMLSFYFVPMVHSPGVTQLFI